MPDSKTENLILFAYDGSEYADAAIRDAARQLRTDRPALVLTVYTPLDAVPFWGGAFGSYPAELMDEVIAGARETAEKGVGVAGAAGFTAEAAVVDGAPVWRRIVEVAAERGAGVIVMGSHGRTAIGNVMIGSVASAVSHHAGCPVLIVRDAKE